MRQGTLQFGRRGGSIAERFTAFLESHPDVYDLFKRFALELKAAGRKRYGAKALVERVRWHYATSAHHGGTMPEINNDFTSRLARRLIEELPEFREFFELRRLKAE